MPVFIELITKADQASKDLDNANVSLTDMAHFAEVAFVGYQAIAGAIGAVSTALKGMADSYRKAKGEATAGIRAWDLAAQAVEDLKVSMSEALFESELFLGVMDLVTRALFAMIPIVNGLAGALSTAAGDADDTSDALGFMEDAISAVLTVIEYLGIAMIQTVGTGKAVWLGLQAAIKLASAGIMTILASLALQFSSVFSVLTDLLSDFIEGVELVGEAFGKDFNLGPAIKALESADEVVSKLAGNMSGLAAKTQNEAVEALVKVSLQLDATTKAVDEYRAAMELARDIFDEDPESRRRRKRKKGGKAPTDPEAADDERAGPQRPGGAGGIAEGAAKRITDAAEAKALAKRKDQMKELTAAIIEQSAALRDEQALVVGLSTAWGGAFAGMIEGSYGAGDALEQGLGASISAVSQQAGIMLQASGAGLLALSVGSFGIAIASGVLLLAAKGIGAAVTGSGGGAPSASAATAPIRDLLRERNRDDSESKNIVMVVASDGLWSPREVAAKRGKLERLVRRQGYA